MSVLRGVKGRGKMFRKNAKTRHYTKVGTDCMSQLFPAVADIIINNTNNSGERSVIFSVP